jgi:hypothetical protein
VLAKVRRAAAALRAAGRGQLPAGLDIATEVDQLVGPIYHRVLVTGDPVDQAAGICPARGKNLQS